MDRRVIKKTVTDIKVGEVDLIPIAGKLPTSKDNIFDYKVNTILDTVVDYPKFSYGFQYFLHQTKDKTEMFTDPMYNKNKPYRIVNPFEHSIKEYDNSVADMAVKYFDLTTKPRILDRAFYKLWEMIHIFDLIPIDQSNYVTAHLAEAPGAFVQATMYFRDKFIGNKYTTKNDKYHAITLHPDSEDILSLNKEFINYCAKEKPERFLPYATCKTSEIKNGEGGCNGDLTKVKTIKNFANTFGKDKRAQFVTGDGGFDVKLENMQEQETSKLFLGQIITAIKIQEKGGNFVCKFFEAFTEPTVKYLYILTQLYEEVYLYKPLFSRESNSEKYVVCKNYLNTVEKNEKLIKILEGILSESAGSKYIIDIFPEFKLPKEFVSMITIINSSIANKQFVAINEMIKYIELNNFYGDIYKQYRNRQIKANEYWNTTYYQETLQKNEKLLKDSLDRTNKKVKQLASVLI